MLLVGVATRCIGATQTITTTYAYNADGAPTAVRARVDAGAPATTYLTWDNFTPDAAAPTSGTVGAANGNLLGVGATPGARFTRQLTYDVRDRLTGCAAGGESVAYAYHPASLMKSSTLAAGDALRFYYDNGPAPRMVNTTQPSSGALASFLGSVRYLSDGREQILFTPRKDVAGAYDAAAKSLAPYDYDPYGVSNGLGGWGFGPTPNPSTPHPISTYDLSDNPFRYTAEYRDPTCDVYYLRSRWYVPAHQTFLSRDRGDGLHRYGYTGGDPIGRIDPSGRRFTAAELGRDADRMVDRLTPGIGAYLEPIVPVWGQVLGGVQLAALLPSFWHHPTAQGDIIFGFLAASIASEAVSAPRWFDARFASPMSAFRWRLLADVTLGASQTAAQSYRHGQVDVPALIQGVETTTYGIFWARLTAGLGYRPFNLSARDLDAGVAQFYADHAGSTDVLVFRVRENLSHLNSTVGGAGRALSRLFDGPLCDQASVGMYHEAVVAVGPDEVVRSELRGDRTVRDNERRQYPYHGFVAGTARYGDGNAAAAVSSRGNAAFLYVGRFAGAKGLQLLDLNPYRFPTPENIDQQLTPPNHDDPTSYNWRTRNAHYHVAAVLRQLRK